MGPVEYSLRHPHEGGPATSSGDATSTRVSALRGQGHPRRHRPEGRRRCSVPEREEDTPHAARMAHDQALATVIRHPLKDDTQVYKQLVENESSKRSVGDMVYAITNP